MKWSLKIGKVKDIGIYVHASFLILVAWIGFIYYIQTKTLSGVLDGVLFIIVLFSIVVMHELAHALTAKKFGIKTRDIILLPIGGMSRMERIPEKPIHELLIAIAGPLSNIVLAIVIYIGLFFSNHQVDWQNYSPLTSQFFEKLFVINVVLAIFNLLPAFPMDGGRVLRAALALKLNYVRATNIAAQIGQFFSIFLGILGLMYNPILVLIAVFIWIGAASESSMIQLKKALQGIPVSHSMVTDFKTLSTESTLQEIITYLDSGFQHDFPVISNGKVIGIINHFDLIKVLSQGNLNLKASEIMNTNFEVIHPNDMLDQIFLKLQTNGNKAIPVIHNQKIVGLLTLQHLGQFLMTHSSLNVNKII